MMLKKHMTGFFCRLMWTSAETEDAGVLDSFVGCNMHGLRQWKGSKSGKSCWTKGLKTLECCEKKTGIYGKSTKAYVFVPDNFVPDKQAVILTLGRGKVEQILCACCAQKLSLWGSW